MSQNVIRGVPNKIWASRLGQDGPVPMTSPVTSSYTISVPLAIAGSSIIKPYICLSCP